MKITPEEIFDITNYYTQNKNKWVTGFIWSDFIEWYKQLLYIVFRCKFYQRNISFIIGESVTGSFTIDVQREFAEEAFNILEQKFPETYISMGIINVLNLSMPLDIQDFNEDQIEEESISYRDYDPPKDLKESKINYPEDNSYNNATNDDDQTYCDAIADENKKEVIVEGMFGKPLVSTEGNFIVEGMFGRPKYYVDGDIIRENNQFGRPAYRIDGNYIREGMFGRPKYYIDGDLIKENNQFGKVVGRKKRL